MPKTPFVLSLAVLSITVGLAWLLTSEGRPAVLEPSTFDFDSERLKALEVDLPAIEDPIAEPRLDVGYPSRPVETMPATEVLTLDRRERWELLLADHDPSVPIPDLKERTLAKLSRSVVRFQDMLESKHQDQGSIEREARIITGLSLLASKTATAPLYDSMAEARDAASTGRVIELEGVFFVLGTGESPLYEHLRERRNLLPKPFDLTEIEQVYAIAEQALGWLE